MANGASREIPLWVRNPDGARLTIRLSDASGQTHQLAFKLETGPDWQHIIVPLERFFARRGQADAVTTVAKYESWGGAKDGRWHGPAKALYLGLGNPGENKVHTLWFHEIALLPRPTEVPEAAVVPVLALDEIV